MNLEKVLNDLLPHNKITASTVLFYLNNGVRRFCVIQPTGTGKSYQIVVVAKHLQEEGKKGIVFIPSDPIKEDLVAMFKKYDVTNMTIMTYAKIGRMTKDDVLKIETDAILLDELHRAGAPTYEVNLKRLIDNNPYAIVFGTTATPIRPSDGKDISVNFFASNKACNISLAEAYVREIIPNPPLYISTLSTIDEEYIKMLEKIEQSNNENKEELKKELFKIRDHIENAIGVPKIIKKHIPNNNGKYIVFCKDTKVLEDNLNEVVRWFHEAGKNNIHTYVFHSKTNNKQYNKFKHTSEDGIHLLFVVNKLNEGVHVKNIDGCILLRGTKSEIVYYQQIGRVIDSSGTKKPIILDLVNNFNNIEAYNLKSEIEVAIARRLNGDFEDCNKVFDESKFKQIVIDYVQEPIKLFEELNRKMHGFGDDWEAWEIKILKEKFPLSGSDIPELLEHRTRYAILAKAKSLNIKYIGKQRSEEIYKFVENNYKNMSNKKMAEHLGVSEGTVRWICNKNNYVRYKNQDQEALDFIKINAPIYGIGYCAKKLNISNRAVINACKRINVEPYSFRKWNDEYDAILIEKFPIYGCNIPELLGIFTKQQISSRAFRLGLRFNKEAVAKKIFYDYCNVVREMMTNGIKVTTSSIYKDYKVGSWIKNMRRKFKDGKLLDFQIKELSNLNLISI